MFLHLNSPFEVLRRAVSCSDSASMREEHFTDLIRSLLACRDNGRSPSAPEITAVPPPHPPLLSDKRAQLSSAEFEAYRQQKPDPGGSGRRQSMRCETSAAGSSGALLCPCRVQTL